MRAALAAVLMLMALVSSAGAGGLGGSSGPSFERARAYATAYVAGFAVGDLTGDGKPDFVSANGSRAHTVSVLINKSNGSFRARREFGTGRGPASVAIGDLNADGSRDVVTANDANTVSVLLNSGDGSLRPKRDYATGRGTRWVSIYDVNGDSKPDLVTANTGNANGISVLLNAGDGTFQAKRDFGPELSPIDLAIDDVNGDSKPDLVTANTGNANGISVLLNAGDGNFQAKRDFGPGLSPIDLAVGELNDDGKPDLAMVDENHHGQGLSAFLNAGDGTFPARREYRTPWNVSSIEIGDVNGDGKPDLLLTSSDQESGPAVSVYLNRGRGRFRSGVDYSLHGDWATGGGSVAIRDLNGDRKADLAVTSRLNAVSVLVNLGDGRFQRQLDYRSGYPRALAIDDLNGDRRWDLMVMNSGTVSVLLNKPGLCTVQDVERQTLIAARRTIVRANCRAGRIRHAYSKIKAGRVISQKPRFGALLRGGSKVNLVVSLGPRS